MTINIGKMLPRDQYEVKFVVCWRKDDICTFIPSDYEVIRIPCIIVSALQEQEWLLSY
jgi:hypothetical protein